MSIRMEKGNYHKWFPILIFIILLFSISIVSFFIPKKTFSSSENRMLAVLPKLTKKGVLKGSFQKKYEAYLSDQFVIRDKWITLKSYAERGLGKNENNGVYFGKDNCLFEKYEEKDFDKKLVEKNIKYLSKALKTWEKEYGKDHVRAVFVPNKSNVLKEKMPAFSQQYKEVDFFKQLDNNISRDLLLSTEAILKEHKAENIYYRTDHHWTTLGAYYGYKVWAKSMGLEPLKEKEFHIKEVSKDFLGTTYSKVNMPIKPDSIFLYYPKKKIKYSLIYNMGEKETNTLYELSMLKKKDKYSVFFGGNQGLIEINTNNKNGKILFVIKDSFANALLPFAVNHFEKTIVIDLRFVNANIEQIMELYKPTDLLILYNTVQFMNSKEISKLNYR